MESESFEVLRRVDSQVRKFNKSGVSFGVSLSILPWGIKMLEDSGMLSKMCGVVVVVWRWCGVCGGGGVVV